MTSPAESARPPRVLVTGATGYVGGRLAPALLERGATVRVLARTPAKLAPAPWADRVEVAPGSLDGDLAAALGDVDVAVYLVHSIGQGPNWAALERTHAENFARAARDAGAARIVYLGGLGRDADRLSTHLASRHEVGRVLAASGVPTVELRAGVVIGSGSASFEMLRYLVDVLPIMVTPRWVTTRCQPLAVSDVRDLLVRAVLDPGLAPGVYEVGGPDVLTYAEMMRRYARVAGLPERRLIRVPLLSPRLSSHWVGLVTPVPVPLAAELVESLINEVVVSPTALATETLLERPPLGFDESVARALRVTREGGAPTTFADADFAVFSAQSTDPDWAGGTVLRDVRTTTVAASPARVFAAVTGLGGASGWPAGDRLWRLRGLLDALVGGPGMRRGRPARLEVGSPLDFWRVEELEAPRVLSLRAEMRLPGSAHLTFEITPAAGGGCTLTQRATFYPRGLLGRLYWYAVAPFHRFVFPGLLAGIARAAIPSDAEPAGTPPTQGPGSPVTDEGSPPR